MSNTFEVKNSVYIDEQSPSMPIVIYLDHDEVEHLASMSTIQRFLRMIWRL